MMFTTILVPTDGSDRVQQAMSMALEFAALHEHGRVVGLAVAEPYPFSPFIETSSVEADEYEQKMRQRAMLQLAPLEEAAKQARIIWEPVIELSFNPAEAIVACASRHRCDAIFLAARSPGSWQRLFIASESVKVLTLADRPVLVFH